METPGDEADGDQEAPSGFQALALDERLLSAIAALGFEKPTAVQARAIPPLLEGRDVIGRARTGSGKTAAFGLPMLELVKAGERNRALVLCPTRELAIQVGNALRALAKHIKGLRIVTIYGGAPYPPQFKALDKGCSIIVGTPGRVIDHMERKSLDLSTIQMLVLDEADEMLRMGFIDEVEKLIAATPATRQVALFSATMPDRIRSVAQTHLSDAVRIEVESHGLNVDHIQQRWVFVPQRFKLDCLVRVLRGRARATTLVFARTRAACTDIAERLVQDGFDIDALHGDLTQAARERVMLRMRARRLRIVIATDVAARGLDVEHIEHVINFDMPDDIEGYVHRIGRTGRAGRDGIAISFVTPRERHRLRDLERRLRTQIEQIQVPTDTDIAEIEASSLVADLEDTVGQGLDAAKRFFERAVESSGLDRNDLAAAALKLLARHEGVSLNPPQNTGPPAWAEPRRPAAARRPHPASDEPEVKLFFPIGKTKGVRPGDIVGMLANEVGLPSGAIGRIDVFSHKSFVSLPESMANHVLKAFPRVALRGIEVPIAVAHAGDQRPPPDRPSSKFRKRPPGPRKPMGGPRKGPRHNPSAPQEKAPFKKGPPKKKGPGFKKRKKPRS